MSTWLIRLFNALWRHRPPDPGRTGFFRPPRVFHPRLMMKQNSLVPWHAYITLATHVLSEYPFIFYKSFYHPSTFLSIHQSVSVIHPSTHPSIHSSMHCGMHYWNYYCIHAFIHPWITTFTLSCIHSSMNYCIHAFMHSCIHASKVIRSLSSVPLFAQQWGCFWFLILISTQEDHPLCCYGFIPMLGWMGGWTNGWMEGWMDEWKDGWMEGWMDGWMFIMDERNIST